MDQQPIVVVEEEQGPSSGRTASKSERIAALAKELIPAWIENGKIKKPPMELTEETFVPPKPKAKFQFCIVCGKHSRFDLRAHLKNCHKDFKGDEVEVVVHMSRGILERLKGTKMDFSRVPEPVTEREWVAYKSVVRQLQDSGVPVHAAYDREAMTQERHTTVDAHRQYRKRHTDQPGPSWQDLAASPKRSSSREAGFPWSKLPQELQVKVLRNLQRRDVDTCRLLNQETFELIRRNEQWMQRRRIEYANIGEVTWDEPYEYMLEVKCAEEEFFGSVELPRLEFVRKMFRHADIDRLHIFQDWHILLEVLSTMVASGCHAHEISLRTKSMSDPMSSSVLGFLRALGPTVMRFDSVGRWLLDDTTADVLQFIVTRERFDLCSVYGDLLPVDDNILQLVTASKFGIDAPNLITLDGLKAFVEEVTSGKRRVDDCIICTSIPIDGISFPTASNVDVKRTNRGYPGIRILRKESEPLV